MTDKLHDIVEDAKASLIEYAIKAAIAGYADGVKLGHDDAKEGELCDAFIRVWNDRAQLLSNDEKVTKSVITSTGWNVTVEKSDYCDGWIAGWNANAHRLKVCHIEKDYDKAMFTCSVCANDLYDMDRYCSKCGSKIVEYGDE